MNEGTPVQPFYQGVEGYDAETIGHIQAKGWDKLDGPKAALEAVKAWKAAEKFVGVPANQIIRVPTDAKDEAGWKTLWQRLGAPADAKEYDFAGVQIGGKDADQAFTDLMRSTAAGLNMPKDSAKSLASAIAKHLDAVETERLATYTAKLADERQALAKNWGANKDANMVVAKSAATALGITPEDLNALESVIGYARIMDLLRNVGSKIGEDKFVQGGGGNGGVMTREQAVARIAELKADEGWTKRYLSGDTAANRELQSLLKISTGDDGSFTK